MSEIDFKISAQTGDILEFGLEVVSVGNTSLTTRCEVRHKKSRRVVITVDRIVFVAVDEKGKPTRHSCTNLRGVESEGVMLLPS